MKKKTFKQLLISISDDWEDVLGCLRIYPDYYYWSGIDNDYFEIIYPNGHRSFYDAVAALDDYSISKSDWLFNNAPDGEQNYEKYITKSGKFNLKRFRRDWAKLESEGK
jgi:hypothetical protein